jgi:hypothetical protein
MALSWLNRPSARQVLVSVSGHWATLASLARHRGRSKALSRVRAPSARPNTRATSNAGKIAWPRRLPALGGPRRRPNEVGLIGLPLAIVLAERGADPQSRRLKHGRDSEAASAMRCRTESGHHSYSRKTKSRPAYAMLTHAQIWNALDRLATRAGLSASGLAKKAGLDPSTFNKSKRITPDGHARWPSTESLAKSLAASGTPIDERAVCSPTGSTG